MGDKEHAALCAMIMRSDNLYYANFQLKIIIFELNTLASLFKEAEIADAKPKTEAATEEKVAPQPATSA